MLVHFNLELQLILPCNASVYGFGAVLSHWLLDGIEKPIAFTSQSLTLAVKEYAQIEKKGLACVFSEKISQLRFCQPFTLVADH